MRHQRQIIAVNILLLALSLSLYAKHEPKTYSGNGKVIATGLNEHTKSRHQWSDASGNSHGGGSYSAYSHTYRVETDTRTYELDCGKTAVFHSTGKACGGDKGLQIGDEIRFRTENDSFYISLADGSEQKLRILKQELKSNEKATSTPSPSN